MTDRLLKVEDLIAREDHDLRIKQAEKELQPERFPILIDGGVGDTIMAIPVIEHLLEFGPLEIYARHPQAYECFRPPSCPRALPTPVPHYSWFMTLNTVARFVIKPGSSGINLPLAEGLFKYQQEFLSEFPSLRVMVGNHPLLDNSIARHAKNRVDRRGFPFLSLGLKVPAPTPPRINLTHGGYITVHDGYETESLVQGRATKTWDMNSWVNLIADLKRNAPDFKIIQLGAKTARPIEGVDECLIDKTTITEAFNVLSRSAIHIDGDSGLVHAATALGVPCVVMFGPTPAHFYGYPQNVNLTSGYCSDACYWLKPDWLAKCPIELDTPRCMDEIKAVRVLEAALQLLSRRSRASREASWSV